jgi:bifunctional non-homologous end joining protein LigD
MARRAAKKAGDPLATYDATRLHYDLRLELDGVLKSWAVTKGPSPDPADKRLAVRTEDHPLGYASFEGTIPKGEYGGGTVMLWDRGTWMPHPGKDPAKSLAQGHLHFHLDGERMKGEWILIRLKPRPGERTENWILRKIEDAHAGSGPSLVDRHLTSVKTGRTMQEIAAGRKKAELKSWKSPGAGRKRRKAELPRFRELQKATLVDAVPAGSGWIHEIKFDGYRCLLAVGGGKARIYTRSGLDWTDKFPEIAEAARGLAADSALLDGEIVKLDDAGRTSFSALQQAIGQGGRGLSLYLFDALELNGEDLTGLPNIERKQRLAALLDDGIPPFLLYADHIVGRGEKLFEAVCEAGQEGIISKKAEARYRGARTRCWLKVKCIQRQEFVVVGWTPSESKGRALRSLLLAVHEDGKLRYAGKVGTGFTMQMLQSLMDELRPRETARPPLEVPRADARGARWVKPELVAEIAFTEFTAEGVVRHPSFLGLRGDKPAEAVVEERPAPVAEVAPGGGEQGDDVKISNPDRVIFPDADITKGELAGYVRAVAPLMLAWAANRPLSLVRCPQGRGKKCFFQKHDAGSFGPHVQHVPIREKKGDTEDYLYVVDQAGLLACVQMGTIEFHGWGSSIAELEKPDRLVFDIDPDVGLDFEHVKKAARDLKRHLGDMGLQSFPMLTGGKGLHVVVPLRPQATWPKVKDFAQRFAIALATAEPDRFTANLAKAQRKDRMFLDYLRNQRGATAILPYSARAREGAPVAAPVSWDELDGYGSGAHFTVRDAATLLERAASRALRGWGEAEQVLPDF